MSAPDDAEVLAAALPDTGRVRVLHIDREGARTL